MKIVTIVGARPQFVKAAMVSRILTRTDGAQELLVHTGQHFDHSMSDVFFVELGIADPVHFLGVSGGSHGEMTGRMLASIEQVLEAEKPDAVLIYGDTNSTLAGALAAAKLHIPVAHVEAGLRSFNMRMPEEVNRIIADRLSTHLYCPTDLAVRNLATEGITNNVHNVGDVMFDAALKFAALAETHGTIMDELGLTPRNYALVTCHRAENTDDSERLTQIISGLAKLSEDMTVILPLHPRTRKCIKLFGLESLTGHIRFIEPVSYLNMIQLESGAKLILTDSGGVQKEAFFFSVPCITMRDETEWTETVDLGWNTLVGANTAAILAAVSNHANVPKQSAHPYGEGNASEAIVALLMQMGNRT
jgi:UDP-GlcNAc3NAcA epimerase